MTGLPQILFEDNHLLIINKRPGEIVQGDKTGDAPLTDQLKLYLKEKYNKPGAVFLGLVHRLDRPVSGAVIFAKTSKALTRLTRMVKDREITKIYLAVVDHLPDPAEGTLVNYLIKNERQNKSYPAAEQTPGAKRAELTYKLIASGKTFHLLEIHLLTGRHHQIRAQLAIAGCHIKGDLKYGAARSNPDGSISLHARMLNFTHPVSRENVSIVAPFPANPEWQYFNDK
ncbi:RluA family pseudouridine synthase [Lentimicrobium sp.]|mgnify:CR=1 FL=1|jgi:23S rRNA pseudouridine1911/1915/1917 synthase|uniref:RluA family pseudouridine synthase n=1 Tax=Lentimicrobium sp. TaxID=2034841 RepID=UPI0025F44F12|nr:RluA family pseudouridine synthase [Lentimicrobium sp.]MCO5255556.1 RluA family pseudouridine synthase [Lentimicrobium sp.]MCO5262881.1 RluA family pseudouridine synthase [Lentimicrobium sp.]HOP12385.1 RluA family pseudouridine synthase [Lentimicrobium sp.]HPF65107.1 RluA family pseudouridine synthase [Lentimicrobium sp.]HPJ61641.1 RluA family pseudouridine synthase [Lentimicrobium sp.]